MSQMHRVVEYNGSLLDVTLYKIDRNQNKIYDVFLKSGRWPLDVNTLLALTDSGDPNGWKLIAGGNIEQGDHENHLIVTVFPR